MTKKTPKLIFEAKIDSLKKTINCNSIPQVSTEFSYVKRWGKLPGLEKEDSDNVEHFFKSIEKLSSLGFKPSKFKEFWIQYNMEDITDYMLIIKSDKDANKE